MPHMDLSPDAQKGPYVINLENFIFLENFSEVPKVSLLKLPPLYQQVIELSPESPTTSGRGLLTVSFFPGRSPSSPLVDEGLR